MDDDNQDEQNRFPERYRSNSSSEAISSTTTPLAQQLLQTGLISRRARPAMNRFSNLNVPAADEDELQPSSSTPSFVTPRQRNRNTGNHLGSSSLASPDSTYAGPSSMSNSYQHRGGRNESNQAPVVQDPCVVSSSTTDDIPQSPFADDSNSHYQVVQQALRASSSPPPPPSPSLHQPTHSIRNSYVSVSRPPATATSESDRDDSSTREGSSQQQLSNVTVVTQGSSYSLSANNITFSASSFSNISPLRNKIKKASSFERFSAQAQASSNNHPGGNNQNNSSTNLHEPNSSIISLSNVPVTTVPPLRSSGGSTWDYGVTTGSNSTKSNFVSSLYDPSSGILSGTKPFKKLVARLANEAEMERLEAEAASALAADNDQARSTNHNSVGCDIVDGVGHHAAVPPQPQQGPSNSSDLVNTVDSLIRRQLSQSTMTIPELPECSNSSGTSFCDPDQARGLPPVTRNPMISAKTFHVKKIPLTPKQKLLHRMQSGEIIIPVSTTPPPSLQQHQQQQIEAITSAPPSPLQQQLQLSPVSEHQQNQILLNSLQPQQHLMMHDLQRQLCSIEEPQASSGGVMEDDSSSPNNDRYSNVMNYEPFIRSSAGEDFSDSMSKGDEGNDGNNQILYDTSDPYSYYYGNILTEDEIFINNNGGNGLGSVPLCVSSHPSTSRIVHSNMIHNSMEDNSIQFQGPTHAGHLEFILGLPETGERSGREDLQLESNEEMQIQQQQFLDSADLSFMGSKATQVAEISTLRNLLMMEPSLARSQHEESWIVADYQNRINSTNLRTSGSMASIPGSNSAGNNNGWPNSSEWPPRVWQGQGQPHDEGVQDEVMDMSVMEIEKSHSNGHSMTKRTSLQHHLHAHPSSGSSQHGLVMDDVELTDRDLANGLPLLTTMPLPMDLQSTFVSNVSGKNQIISDPSTLIMTPHHHHQRGVILEYEEEPVNLMSAVNLEQALVQHSQSSRESENINISMSHSQQGHSVTPGL